ncbi:MAG: LptF/LptG family permease [Candidatus Omnitrophica bacterium]|nr:LptF/LptG family permease [Candidatus Omnitrophota bacterium]
MRIIDRYIFKQVTSGYVLLLVAFLFLYVIIDASSQLQDILKDKIPFLIILKYYLFFLPQIFIVVSPFSFLLSSLYCIGVLNKDNEIISLRTQGMSVLGIAQVFIVLAIFLSFVSLFLEDQIIPQSYGQLKQIRGYKELKLKEDEIVEKFAFYSSEGYVVFARDFNLSQRTLNNVNVFVQDEKGNITHEIIAEKLVYRAGSWNFINASFYMLVENRLMPGSPSFMEERELDLSDTPRELFEKSNMRWQDLSLKDIQNQISKLAAWKARKIINSLRVEFHRKIALSFSTFFMLLGSLPFALKIKKRQVGLSSLGLAFFTGFLYYVMFSLSSPLGKVDFFFPWLSCWLPNVFFGISGAVGLYTLT